MGIFAGKISSNVFEVTALPIGLLGTHRELPL